MARQDLGSRMSELLRQGHDELHGTPVALPGAAAVAVAAAGGHALLGAPDLTWLTAAAVSAAALLVGTRVLWLAAAAAVLHGVVDVALALPGWRGAPAVRGLGILATAALGVATGVMIRRHEDAHRRSQDEDAITGLLNVRAFYDGLHDLRARDEPVAILLADIAGMRNLNERYGHPTGTEAMRALGHVLRRCTKRRDLVARLGSDEVAVALVGTNRDGALAAARRLGQLLSDERIALPDGRTFRVHAHYGIATSSEVPAEDDAALLRAADHAKVAAKQAGVDEIGIAADASDEHFEIVHPNTWRLSVDPAGA